MVYTELKKLRDTLENKANKSEEENRLLSELKTLSPIIDRNISEFSLIVADNTCPVCGRKLK